jgi:tetratricopeptide (TPR) repeat protein
MPSGQNEPQLSAAELNRKIVELGHEIALNPRNATTYRKRGMLYGKIQYFDNAILDFDRALTLNPNDASAHYLRGLAWHRKNELTRAITDYDKAIELDPANPPGPSKAPVTGGNWSPANDLIPHRSIWPSLNTEH